MEKEKIILGIDPGTSIMGYGIISVQRNKINLENFDILNLKNIDNHALKLKGIFEKTLEIIEQYKPDELAVEAPFYGKNVQSMLKLGRAQGVAMAAALFKEIPIFEYSPKKIKQSITGSGNATKEQVALMLKNLLKFQEIPKHLDATDGLAVAVCHHFQSNTFNASGKYTGWKSFIKENEDRVSK
ncbi:MAG: crossover junction endodeoxyribonuclease RuvC [Bacteroidetes bacterium]|nr:crossover junction endodeoxyribonuclease RuvC [Sphingobacteriaceae bacterium AH-315-L07]PCH69674.1 MAG: crossover junction endodeoxyribonuclease RuvC [Bacteroidota bacterium]